ncbi:hypothetical protein BCR35DRAFT_104422 [Leucosporidium creatinivorum]|uniref:F-box domain-containing protein n=1 Tax=Leucosporidium creatinivorum TaxID=106004 RepID=A0A1Y2G3Q6_9BASI|nr:hypothetical protein BCR35DRAFT_104422 [Leucosporidium creatinivorum]
MDAYAKRLSAASRALEQPATVQDSLVLAHAPLLSAVFAQVPQDTLLSLALVSRDFNAVATELLLSRRPIRLDSARSVEAFGRLVLEHPQVGQRIKAFDLTK